MFTEDAETKVKERDNTDKRRALGEITNTNTNTNARLRKGWKKRISSKSQKVWFWYHPLDIKSKSFPSEEYQLNLEKQAKAQRMLSRSKSSSSTATRSSKKNTAAFSSEELPSRKKQRVQYSSKIVINEMVYATNRDYLHSLEKQRIIGHIECNDGSDVTLSFDASSGIDEFALRARLGLEQPWSMDGSAPDSSASKPGGDSKEDGSLASVGGPIPNFREDAPVDMEVCAGIDNANESSSESGELNACENEYASANSRDASAGSNPCGDRMKETFSSSSKSAANIHGGALVDNGNDDIDDTSSKSSLGGNGDAELDGYDTDDCIDDASVNSEDGLFDPPESNDGPPLEPVDTELKRKQAAQIEKKKSSWINECQVENVECIKVCIKALTENPSKVHQQSDEHAISLWKTITPEVRRKYFPRCKQAGPTDKAMAYAEERHKKKFGHDSGRVQYQPAPPPNRKINEFLSNELGSFIDFNNRSLSRYDTSGNTGSSCNSNPLMSHDLFFGGNYPGHLKEELMKKQGNVLMPINENDILAEPYHRVFAGICRQLDFAQGNDQNTSFLRTFHVNAVPIVMHNKSGAKMVENDDIIFGLSAKVIRDVIILFGTPNAQFIANGKGAFIFTIDHLAPLLRRHNMLHHLFVWGKHMLMSAPIRHMTYYSRGFALPEEARSIFTTCAETFAYEVALEVFRNDGGDEFLRRAMKIATAGARSAAGKIVGDLMKRRQEAFKNGQPIPLAKNGKQSQEEANAALERVREGNSKGGKGKRMEWLEHDECVAALRRLGYRTVRLFKDWSENNSEERKRLKIPSNPRQHYGTSWSWNKCGN